MAPAQVPKISAAFVGKFADGVVETFFLEELELRGAFAAGEDEAVAAVEIGDGADFDGVERRARGAWRRGRGSRLGWLECRFS